MVTSMKLFVSLEKNTWEIEGFHVAFSNLLSEVETSSFFGTLVVLHDVLLEQSWERMFS